MTSAKHTEHSVAQLHELGIDPATPPAEAVTKLASLRTGENEHAIARALGQIATPEAVRLLDDLARGDPAVRLTREAVAARERIKQRESR